MRALFDAVADAVCAAVRPGEFAAGLFDAEASEFVRLNRGRLRQAGRVERATLRLRLVRGERQAAYTATLPGLAAPRAAVEAVVDAALQALRAALDVSAPDPLLDLNRTPLIDLDDAPEQPFDRDAFVDAVAASVGDADLVGFCAAGPVARGFCSSSGSRLWHRRTHVAFDWSIHLPVDAGADGARKAVKASWSGTAVDRASLTAAITASIAQSRVLARPVRRLARGECRALLAPRAVADLLELLGWGGFSARADRTGQSALSPLARGTARLSPLLSITEDLEAGFAPRFQADGYLRPRQLPLVRAGTHADWLVCPGTAREFGLASNAADDAETPESLVVAPGTMPASQALARLGTGVAISNLWYLNYADRAAGRMTGMTRFASLWVEDGEPIGPIEAMRFDDSIWRMLGEALEALGDTPQRMPATDTYAGRTLAGIQAPCALLSALRFVL